MVGEMFQLSS